jgi:Maltokinase N-terminal cap domain
MAVVHKTTLVPTKLELLAGWLPGQPWYVGGDAPELARVGGFRLDDPDGEVGIEFMAVGAGDVTYHVPMTYRAAPLDGSEDALIGTAEHGVLGTRWIYDGVHDPVLVAQLVALLHGKAEPQAQSQSHTPDPTVWAHPVGDDERGFHVCRVLEPDVSERPGVSGTWRRADGEQVRGYYVTAGS